MVFGVLLAVMAAVYVRALRHPPVVPPSPAPTTAEATDAASEPSASSVEALTVAPMSPEALAARESQRRRATELAWGRDPFVTGDASGQASGLELSGILWDPAEPMAIINGQTVHPGEDCEGYRVVSMTHDTVTLTDGVETFRLSTTR